MPPSRKMKQVEPERVGRALRKMAEDLVTERRRVVLLERENRMLKNELEQLRRSLAELQSPAGSTGRGRRPDKPT